MAHFAQVDDKNVVQQVIVVDNKNITIDGIESEQAGIDFLTGLHGHSLWKQTSYNGSTRKNYAGIDYSYDSSRDAFIAPKTYPSWILNETTCKWEAPTPMPEDDKTYSWDEDTTSWVEVNI